MGRKVPPANDGSNYYAARKGNSIEGVSFNQAILDEVIDWGEVTPPAVKGGHFITLTNNSNWTFQPMGSSGLISTSTTSNGIFTSGGGGYARTTVAAPNSNPSFGNLTWTTSQPFSIDMASDPLMDMTLTPEQRNILLRQREEMPSHEWNPGVWGWCEDCPSHNIYRHDANKHLFVIDEPMDAEDWWEQLAS